MKPWHCVQVRHLPTILSMLLFCFTVWLLFQVYALHQQLRDPVQAPDLVIPVPEESRSLQWTLSYTTAGHILWHRDKTDFGSLPDGATCQPAWSGMVRHDLTVPFECTWGLEGTQRSLIEYPLPQGHDARGWRFDQETATLRPEMMDESELNHRVHSRIELYILLMIPSFLMGIYMAVVAWCISRNSD